MSTKLGKIAFLTLAPALVAMWAVSHVRSAPAHRGPAAASDAAPDPVKQIESAATLDGAYRLEEGKRYVYRFERKIQIKGFSKSIPEIAYGGELYIDVTHRFNGGFEALLSEKLTAGSAGAAPDLALQIRVEDDDRKVEIELPELKTEAETQHANLLKDLVALWLFPLDQDTVGTYEAKYDPARANGDVWTLKKVKTAYLKTDAETPRPEIVFSEHILEWRDSEGMPRRIRGQESTTLGQPGTGSALTMASASSYTITFEKTETFRLREKALDIAKAHGTWGTLALSGNPKGKGSRMLNAGPSRWSELLAQLEPESLQALSRKEQLALFGDLLHELRAYPENLAKLSSLLTPNVIQAGPQSALFKMAVGALATVGTSDAQTSLLAIYGDSNCPVGGKGTILAALTTTEAPLLPSVREFLLNTTQAESNSGLASGAAFALGSSLANAPSDATTQRAIAAIQSAPQTTVADQRNLLDVIGNSGRPEFLPMVTAVIASDQADPGLRSKAVYSLRFMPSAQASGLLVASLGDADPGVRLAAASAIQLAPWTPTYVAPLQNCSAGEAVPAIQTACQTALHRAL